MTYRNGVYIAFNGCGTNIPTESDIRYYNILKAWNNNDGIDFNFVNSHEKTYQVKDTSSESTLKGRLSERLKDSKSLLLIVTENTKNCSEILEHEIVEAVDKRQIPIIVAYTDSVTYGDQNQLPEVLKERIKNKTAKIIYVKFEKDEIKWAIDNFGVNDVLGKKNAIYRYDRKSNSAILH
ncbi:TIR domain-containing protein [Methanolapillus millepedarum]|uniref:Thoeris protein ThsB TIR-like domain-containing protein n=1 Tax=Methanolapillus millepedarum TaxID=3028296 RepID=A0AA96ZTV2_9EURY|nr:hypothetical protein MsAc7_04330 [Methanosarcinaceae archaeon Ac7]